MKNYSRIISPVGDLYLVADDKALKAIVFASFWKSYKKENKDLIEDANVIIQKTAKQLDEYFKGTRKQFDIPVKLEGTEFQVKAWKHLMKIPFGKTISYKEQALAVGSGKAVRAIGSANGVNQIPIIIPCHRVISSSGALSGYGGGVKIKKYLLEFEKK